MSFFWQPDIMSPKGDVAKIASGNFMWIKRVKNIDKIAENRLMLNVILLFFRCIKQLIKY